MCKNKYTMLILIGGMSMSNGIEFVVPSVKYLSSYAEAVKEYEENNVKTYSFSNPNQCDIFDKFQRYGTGKNIPESHVPSSYFWLTENDEFIGEVSIRHRLTDELLRRGGHIGYGVKYSKWNNGYGTELLHQALLKAKYMNLHEVLITCNDDNIGSAKVIEKNGGLLENKLENIVDGKQILTRRYWIYISNC